MKDLLKKILGYVAYLPVHQPVLLLIPLVAGTIFFAWYLPRFSLDSSTDALILKHDPNFDFYNQTRKDFTSDDYIIVSFALKDDVFSEKNLALIKNLTAELGKLERVRSIQSVTSVPLFFSPPFKIHNLFNVVGEFADFINHPATAGNIQERAEKAVKAELARKYGTQTAPADEFKKRLKQKIAEYIKLAREEIITHPVYRDNLLSADGKTTSIMVDVLSDEKLNKYEELRAFYRKKYEQASDNGDEDAPQWKEKWDEAQIAFMKEYDERGKLRERRLNAIREITKRYEKRYGIKFYLGGVPVIAINMVNQLQHDVVFYSIAIVGLLALMLLIIFRRFRWMLIPMITCIIVAVWIIGAMAYNGDRGNLVTANVITLIFVIAMAHSIHLIIKYREFQQTHPQLKRTEHLKMTLRIMAIPCFYIALTTAAGFSSLLATDLKMIATFGKYMTTSVFLALIVSFVAFPVSVRILGPSRPPRKVEEQRTKFMRWLARNIIKSRYWLIALVAGIIIFSAFNIPKISVEMKYGDYFPKDSEVYQGLSFIDKKVGGSSPLEIIFTAKKGYYKDPKNFEPIERTMKFLETLPEVGKIDALPNLFKVAKRLKTQVLPKPMQMFFTDKKIFDLFLEKAGKAVWTGYVTQDFSKTRLLTRIKETYPNLNREKLLAKIEAFLRKQNFKNTNARLTGVFLMYSRLLASLVNSQIKTFGLVFVAVFIMFLVLFQSLRLALIAMLPNLLPIALVLGLMGALHIPLDFMTVMIASVTMGIAVDGTIHYVFRFKAEIKKSQGNYKKAIFRAHQTIGQSILFTFLTVIGGFWVLILSGFIATRVFGILTGAAMAVALFAALTLLPALIYILKPVKFKRKNKTAATNSA